MSRLAWTDILFSKYRLSPKKLQGRGKRSVRYQKLITLIKQIDGNALTGIPQNLFLNLRLYCFYRSSYCIQPNGLTDHLIFCFIRGFPNADIISMSPDLFKSANI